jgi:hypothetical protein
MGAEWLGCCCGVVWRGGDGVVREHGSLNAWEGGWIWEVGLRVQGRLDGGQVVGVGGGGRLKHVAGPAGPVWLRAGHNCGGGVEGRGSVVCRENWHLGRGKVGGSKEVAVVVLGGERVRMRLWAGAGVCYAKVRG